MTMRTAKHRFRRGRSWWLGNRTPMTIALLDRGVRNTTADVIDDRGVRNPTAVYDRRKVKVRCVDSEVLFDALEGVVCPVICFFEREEYNLGGIPMHLGNPLNMYFTFRTFGGNMKGHACKILKIGH
jgi:hypothetical protein